MIERDCDLWDLHAKGAWVVIPTNLQHSRGRAHMGKGLAKQAAERFPELPALYGEDLAKRRGLVVYPDMRVICFPTKRHWRDPSSLNLIEACLGTLESWHDRFEPSATVALPHLGCGLGGLRWEDVRPLVEAACPGEWCVVCSGRLEGGGGRG